MHEVRTALITSILSLLVLAFISTFSTPVAVSSDGLLEVTFLDVGQGDATYIESPSGTQVLVDGGRDGMVLGGLEKMLGFFDTNIDMVIATHPDADHIGGLIQVLEKYEVGTILLTENINDTPVRDAFMQAVEDENAQVLFARSGQMYEIGVGDSGTTTMRILFPDIDPTNLESNTSSIIMQIQYGNIGYMLTGDSPKAIEEYLVGKEGAKLESEVLKVGHHGSRTSTAETFVSALDSQYAIISAGKDNSYGHPHREVLDILKENNLIIKNTADEGNITMLSNGKDIWVK